MIYKYRLYTTSPHPTRPAHTHCADQGQVGWKLHFVDLTQGPVYQHRRVGEQNKSPALCGLIPKHGWGVDMFIDAPCSRCLKAAKRLGLTDLEPLP